MERERLSEQENPSSLFIRSRMCPGEQDRLLWQSRFKDKSQSLKTQGGEGFLGEHKRLLALGLSPCLLPTHAAPLRVATAGRPKWGSCLQVRALGFSNLSCCLAGVNTGFILSY